MTIDDHDDEMTEKPISFHVDTTNAVGEPVFPDEESLEASSEISESISDEDSEVSPESDDEMDSDLADEEGLEMSQDAEANDVRASSETDALESSETDVRASSETDALESSETDASESAGDDDALALQEDLTLSGKIESILFASPKPMRAVEIHELLLDHGYTLKEIQDACDQLIEFYRDRAGGFHLKYIKRMGYQFQTTPAAKPLMEKQFSSRPRPLSRAALETLAVIAYRQKLSKGVTRAEVEFIRGVDAGSIFKTLVERNLLTCTGRKEIPGRPMMFGVTDEFLKVFQLGSINDLPPLESFQTPQDVLEAANQKIADFEAEQEGVDTEEFIADEEYSSEVRGAEDFNPLAADAPSYAPTLERLDEVRDGVAASESDTQIEATIEVSAEASIEASIEASMETAHEMTSEGDLDIGESKADLIDVLNEGQVAWSAGDVHTEERSIQGATVGGQIYSLDAINEDEWDQDVQVETTATESAESAPLEAPGDELSEAQPNERDETTEMAVPAGSGEPPRGGEVDQ